MNLENEISAVSGCAFNFALDDNDSERNHEEVEPCLRKADAIRIAKQYAEEMCKHQREICANEFIRDRTRRAHYDVILNAQLVTEEKK